MKKGLIITLVSIGAVILILVISMVTTYNGLVTKEEAVNTQRSIIDVNVERQNELIPDLIETVKGYSDYEQETFLAVTEARNNVAKATDAVEKADASAQLDKAVDNWINVVVENYPELKSSDQYNDLMVQLEGTSNRIATARKDYVRVVGEYNKAVRRFPSNIIAGMFGFEKVEYFESTASDVTVDFS